MSPLLVELREVDMVRLSGNMEEFLTRLKVLREHIDAFTLTQSGTNLDYIGWGVPFETCYAWADAYACSTVEDADSLTREGLHLLAQAQPAQRRAALMVGVKLVTGHAQQWMERDPARCADLLDAYECMLRETGDRKALYVWNRRAPTIESNFLCFSTVLPEEERAAFYTRRESKLKAYLTDESVPLDVRTRQLWGWIEHLSYIGDLSKAVELMESWWRAYGDEIASAEYFNERVWLALFGEGDFEKASDVLRRASDMADRWTRPSDRRQFQAMTKTYYDGLLCSGYELKRLKRVEQAARERKLRAQAPAEEHPD